MSWCGRALRHRGRLPVPPLHQHHPCHGLLRPGSAPPALPGGIQQSRHPWSSRLPSPDRLPLLTRSLCRAPCSPHQSRPTPALQAAQHLLPVRNLGPKPWFCTFFFFGFQFLFRYAFRNSSKSPRPSSEGRTTDSSAEPASCILLGSQEPHTGASRFPHFRFLPPLLSLLCCCVLLI